MIIVTQPTMDEDSQDTMDTILDCGEDDFIHSIVPRSVKRSLILIAGQL